MPESASPTFSGALVTKEIVESAIVLIGAIVHELVTYPNTVSLTPIPLVDTTVILLVVHPRDLPGIVGDQARTARSLRSLLQAISQKAKYRLTLEINSERNTVKTIYT